MAAPADEEGATPSLLGPDKEGEVCVKSRE